MQQNIPLSGWRIYDGLHANLVWPVYNQPRNARILPLSSAVRRAISVYCIYKGLFPAVDGLVGLSIVI